VWLSGKTRDGKRYLMPTRDLREMEEKVLKRMLQSVDCFFPIPEAWLPLPFKSDFIQDDSDYLYTRVKIAEFPGRALAPKRNLVKQFLENYEARVVPYNREHLKGCLSILESWQSSFKGAHSDFPPNREGLEMAEKLGLSGFVVYVGEEPAGFVLGEEGCKDHYIIHFAKASTSYKGIYPFLFQESAKRLEHENISMLNLEQDLGEAGLRQSKLSYEPDSMLHKVRLSLALR
jgi:hypothetical protein